MIDENIRLADLIDVDTLQRVQDSFAMMARMATLITDEKGRPLTEGTNFSEYCTEFCRKSPIGRKRCEECDRKGAEAVYLTKQPYSYYCHANLVDFAAPIMLGDRMIGSFIGGQVLAEEPDLDKMRVIAKEIGVEEDPFIEAAKKIQVVPKAAIDRSTKFIYEFAHVISDMAYKAYESRMLSEEAMQATKMKSDFLANMSHEIRTPMNAILGMAEMALRQEMPGEVREYIHQIKSSGKNLLVIINDILDFSKIESGKLDIIEVNYEPFSLINDISSIINSRIGDKDIEFILNIPYDLPTKLFGDNVRIQQILINLLNNAVKFTKRGKVQFDLMYEQLSDTEVMLKAVVSDTGIGIKKEDLGKLFKSFQQVDSKRNRNIEGTGLGLAISQQLLSLMGGKVSVESEYEKGSTFYIEVPQKILSDRVQLREYDHSMEVAVLVSNSFIKNQLFHDLEAVGIKYYDLTETNIDPSQGIMHMIIDRESFTEEFMKQADDHPDVTYIIIEKYNTADIIKKTNVKTIRKPVYSLSLYTALGICDEIDYEIQSENDDFVFTAPDAHILIVDDNPINLTVAKGLLEPLNMQIDLANGANETISLVTKKMYDIIFMDHMMPEVDGVETTHIIRRMIPNYEEVPIIALTANAVGGTKEMFLNEGMNDFVAKPIEIKDIVSKIRKWLPPEKIIPADPSSVMIQQPKKSSVEISGLNTEAALSLLGSETLFWTVLKEYYCAMDKKADVIRTHWQSGNIKNYTVEVHSLKSTSKQIGADDVAVLAARLEQAGNENDVSFINENTEHMLAVFMKYKNILAPHFPDVVFTDEKKAASSEELLALLDELAAALDEMDILVIEEVLDKFNAYELVSGQDEYFESLKAAAEDFDLDNCAEIISVWKSEL